MCAEQTVSVSKWACWCSLVDNLWNRVSVSSQTNCGDFGSLTCYSLSKLCACRNNASKRYICFKDYHFSILSEGCRKDKFKNIKIFSRYYVFQTSVLTTSCFEPTTFDKINKYKYHTWLQSQSRQLTLSDFSSFHTTQQVTPLCSETLDLQRLAPRYKQACTLNSARLHFVGCTLWLTSTIKMKQPASHGWKNMGKSCYCESKFL